DRGGQAAAEAVEQLGGEGVALDLVEVGGPRPVGPAEQAGGGGIGARGGRGGGGHGRALLGVTGVSGFRRVGRVRRGPPGAGGGVVGLAELGPPYGDSASCGRPSVPRLRRPAQARPAATAVAA